MDSAQEKRYKMMLEYPVGRLVLRTSVPTIISMLVTSIYNMADTFFVSQLDTSASGAVGVVFSLMAIIQAVGFTFAMGSGNNISQLLGKKDSERAEKIAATGFFSAFIGGVIIMIFGLIFLKPLLYLLGSTDSIYLHAAEYARYILIGAPFMAASFVLNNILRSQGNPFYSMIGLMAGGILNIALDPLFIFTFEMKIAGAALATIISQFVSFILLSVFCHFKGTVKVKIKNFSFKWNMYRDILHVGFPSFCRQGLAATASAVLNNAAKAFGDPAISAMTIVSKLMMFMQSALIGFGQGYQPVSGFNYGAKKYDRVYDAYKFSAKVAVGILIILSGAMFFAATPIMTVFRRDDLEVIKIGADALRYQCIAFPLMGFTIITNMLFQSTGAGFRATFMALAQQGLFFIPLVVILPSFMDILGVQISQAIANVLTTLLAIPFMISYIKKIKKPVS